MGEEKTKQKSSKKAVIITSCVAVALIAVGTVVAINIINNNDTNNAEYVEQVETYDKYVEAAEKVNNYIDDSVKSVDETVKQDIGDDKTKIDEINAKKDEILGYRINVLKDKPKNVDKLKEETNKLKEGLDKVDEKLATLSASELIDYKISDDSKVVVLAGDIAKLTSEINALAAQQAEKKAAEEKEAEEKRAAEEARQKILNGDISAFNGIYQEGSNQLLIKEYGFQVENKFYKTSEMKEIKQEDDGSYKFLVRSEETSPATGRTVPLETFFRISADGKTVDFCQDLGCMKYTRI